MDIRTWVPNPRASPSPSSNQDVRYTRLKDSTSQRGTGIGWSVDACRDQQRIRQTEVAAVLGTRAHAQVPLGHDTRLLAVWYVYLPLLMDVILIAFPAQCGATFSVLAQTRRISRLSYASCLRS